MRFLLAPGVLFAASCINIEIPWERTDPDVYTMRADSFRFVAPSGWAVAGDSFLTRDGASLQFIAVMELTEASEASPEELAASLALQPGVSDVQCTPTNTVGLRDVTAIRFRATEWSSFLSLDWLYPSRDARSYLAYWITEGERDFLLLYSAPPLHYFERDLPAFERLVASFEPLPPADA